MEYATGSRVHFLRRSGLACNREVVQAGPRTGAALLLDDPPQQLGGDLRGAGLITRRIACGSCSRVTSPFGAVMRRTTNGRMSCPPLAIAAYAAAICIGVTETPCPKLWVSEVDARPRLLVAHDARATRPAARRRSAGRSRTSAARVVALAPEPVADLGRADVARELDHLGERQPAVRMRIVDRPLADVPGAVLAEEAVGGLHHAPPRSRPAARMALKVDPGS